MRPLALLAVCASGCIDFDLLSRASDGSADAAVADDLAAPGSADLAGAPDLLQPDLAGSIATPGTWTVRALGQGTTEMHGVWGIGSDVYLVGANALVLYSHNGGTSFLVATGGALASGFGDLWQVWGSSPTDVYAVGDNATVLHSVDHGVTWTSVASSGGTDALYNIWGTGPDNLYAVGGAADVSTAIYYCTSTGGTFVKVPLATTVATMRDLRGIWGSSKTDVYASGQSGTFLHSAGGVNDWVKLSEPNPGQHALSVWGSDANHVFVGTRGVYGKTATGWTALYDLNGDVFWSVWGFSQNEVYSVGENAVIFHTVDGKDFVADVSNAPSTVTLFRVWGSSPGDVWAVGTAGTILHKP